MFSQFSPASILLQVLHEKQASVLFSYAPGNSVLFLVCLFFFFFDVHSFKTRVSEHDSKCIESVSSSLLFYATLIISETVEFVLFYYTWLFSVLFFFSTAYVLSRREYLNTTQSVLNLFLASSAVVLYTHISLNCFVLYLLFPTT